MVAYSAHFWTFIKIYKRRSVPILKVSLHESFQWFRLDLGIKELTSLLDSKMLFIDTCLFRSLQACYRYLLTVLWSQLLYWSVCSRSQGTATQTHIFYAGVNSFCIWHWPLWIWILVVHQHLLLSYFPTTPFQVSQQICWLTEIFMVKSVCIM